MMKSDGYMPYIRGESPIEDSELRSAIAWRIGYHDYISPQESNTSDGLSEDTVVFEGIIPPKYLKVMEK